MVRSINLKPIRPPQTLTVSDAFSRYHLEEMSHIPGQAAAIRFFDPDSASDFHALSAILTSKPARTWMDDTGRLSRADYQAWAGKHTSESFLFAVHDSRHLHLEDIQQIRGFVSVYSEHSEKFRVKRLQKAGFLPKTHRDRHFLEVSMAASPITNQTNSHKPGLMSSAMRQSCLQVRSLLGHPKQSDLILFGFVAEGNLDSRRAMEASGFTLSGTTKYDPDSREPSLLYLLNWRILHRKIKEKMVNRVGGYMKVIPEPQQTDSHCGPAVVRGLLRYHQIDVTQDHVVQAAKLQKTIIKYGMTPSQIYLAIKILAPKLRFWYKLDATGKDISTLIHEYNLPVGINWQGLFYDNTKQEKKEDPNGEHGHHSIVVDIRDHNKHIVIDDPYSEYFNLPRVFSYRWFHKRWWDVDPVHYHTPSAPVLRFNRLLFIVAPKSIHFPAKIGLQSGENLPTLNC